MSISDDEVLRKDRGPEWCAIFDTLRHHRLSNMTFEGSDDPFCLVDLVSTIGSDISTGEAQLLELADEISLAVEAAAKVRAIREGDGEWQPIETAPVACTLLATYFDEVVGEWIVQIFIADKPTAPFTHWQFITSPRGPWSPSGTCYGSKRISGHLTRPIIGIENRSAQEVFEIMCDRIRLALAASPIPATTGGVK